MGLFFQGGSTNIADNIMTPESFKNNFVTNFPDRIGSFLLMWDKPDQQTHNKAIIQIELNYPNPKFYVISDGLVVMTKRKSLTKRRLNFC